MKAGVFAGVVTLAAAALAAGCASAPPASDSRRPAASVAQRSPGFVGYRWAVIAISHDGRQISVHDRRVRLQFSPDGQFSADDSATFCSGSYRLTTDGFTTYDIACTAGGSAGNIPADVLTRIAAIRAITQPADVSAAVDATRLTLAAGGYTLTCDRSGPQTDYPTPMPTATSTGS